LFDVSVKQAQLQGQEKKMGKLVVSQFITMDGVAEAPGNEDFERGGWSSKFSFGAEGAKFKYDEAMTSGALLLGRVTYEGFSKAWPSRTGEFADKYNGMPKYVVSTTLKEPEWNNTTVIAGDVVQAVSKLKRDVSGDVLVNGSIRLVHSLIEHDLVDEYRLMIFPVILGAGKRLFEKTSAPVDFKLTDTRRAGDTAVLTFVPERNGSATKRS
jgi:dihydrofolate reductase